MLFKGCSCPQQEVWLCSSLLIIAVFFAVTMPGRPAPQIKPKSDGSVVIEYNPQQPGVHEMSLSYNEHHVDGKVNVTL